MIVDLTATSTKTGLKVRAQIDSNLYPSGLKVSDKQVAALHIERDAFMENGTTRSCRRYLEPLVL